MGRVRRPGVWRVFLHATQQLLVEKPFTGPARATGGPGTGKTVVALHRAYRLAERADGRVLLTTFTSTLSAALDAGLLRGFAGTKRPQQY